MASTDGQGADLMSLGQHCSVPSCSQIDFLPFNCDCCSKVYCLSHRTYTAHQCPHAGSKQTEVIVCPLCAKGVKLNGLDPNLAFEEHQRSSGCDPSNYARVHKKPKCPVKLCREKLTTVNTYHCSACGQRVCLKHRHELDHDCAAAKAAAAAARSKQFQQQILGAPSAFAASLASQARKLVTTAAQPTDPANTVKGSAERRKQGAPTSNANPQVPAHLPEVCPQCGARFASVDKLVTHVEEYHQHPQQQGSGWLSQFSSSISSAFNSAAQAVSSAANSTFGSGPAGTAGTTQQQQQRPSTGGGQGSELFRCPHCRQAFTDAVLLVSHAESCRT